MSKKTIEKLAKLSSRAEAQADAILTKWVNFPYSWIPAAVVGALAGYGLWVLVM